FDFYGSVTVRESQDKTVVGPHGFDFDATLSAQFGGYGHAPRGMHAAAKRSQDAYTTIAKFIAANFHHHILVAGHALRSHNLILQIAKKIFCGINIQAMFFNELRTSDVA